MISKSTRSSKNLSVAIDARVLSMPATGTAYYIKSVVKALLKAGFNITLVSNAPLWVKDSFIKKCKLVILPKRSRFLWEQITLLKCLNKNNFDIYWAPWNYGLPFLYRGKTKFVLSILDMIPMRFPELHLPRKRDKFIYELSMRIAVKRAAKIITISKASAKDFEHYFTDKKAIPIHIRLKKSPVVKIKKNNQKFFLYIGGVDPRKNIDSLIKAFALYRKNFSDKKLVLVGQGFEQFCKLIEELGITDQVALPGYISEAKKQELLSTAKALIYPSSIEGYGLPVAEAILANTDVIAGANPALKEIAGKAAIFINPNQPKSIVKAMLELDKPSVKKRLAEARRLQTKIYLDPKIDSEVVRAFKCVVDES